MKHPRRTFLQFAVAAAAAPAFLRIASAQAFPTRPITIVVPFPAGGSTDAISRIVGEPMRRSLGQPIVIENVSGADGSIGVGRVARARPDGYTISVGAMDTHVLNGAFYSLPYDVLNDLVPISPLVTAPAVLFARKTMPANDLNEFIAWLKANPNKASAGVVALAFRLITMFLQRETSTAFVLVPYRGAAPAVQDLAAGQIDLLFATPDQLPQMRAGNIKAYAVTSDRRLTAAPDVPTFAEWDWRRFRSRTGSAFSRLKARRGTSSASSMQPPWRHWPIRRWELGSSPSGLRRSRLSNRPRRRSAHL